MQSRARHASLLWEGMKRWRRERVLEDQGQSGYIVMVDELARWETHTRRGKKGNEGLQTALRSGQGMGRKVQDPGNLGLCIFSEPFYKRVVKIVYIRAEVKKILAYFSQHAIREERREGGTY